MGERKKAGYSHPLEQPALASNIHAGQRASVLLHSRLCAKRGGTDSSEERPQHPTASLRRKVAISNPPPDPNHPLVAYRGPSLARADAAGLLKSGPSSWRGARNVPAKDMVCTGEKLSGFRMIRLFRSPSCPPDGGTRGKPVCDESTALFLSHEGAMNLKSSNNEESNDLSQLVKG
jgi:hypothetical protein